MLTSNKQHHLKQQAMVSISAIFLLNVECLFLIVYLNFYQSELHTQRQLDQLYTEKIINFAN